MIKRWKVLAVIALVGVVSCEKEDLSTPHPGDKNDYPEEPPVLDLPEPTCDLAVVIEEAQSLDGQHLCPQTDVTLTVSMTQTDSISFMKVYKNSITGEEQHYLIETVYDGAHSITRVGEELMDYLIYAIVYENSCVDKTPRFSFSGYDFAPPAIEHDKLHTGLCGPDGFVQIRNGFPGP